MIDAKTDAAGAVEEIEFLAEHLDAGNLRDAINRVLLIGLMRGMKIVDRESGSLTKKVQAQIAEDYAHNVIMSFLHSVGEHAIVRREVTP